MTNWQTWKTVHENWQKGPKMKLKKDGRTIMSSSGSKALCVGPHGGSVKRPKYHDKRLSEDQWRLWLAKIHADPQHVSESWTFRSWQKGLNCKWMMIPSYKLLKYLILRNFLEKKPTCFNPPRFNPGRISLLSSFEKRSQAYLCSSGPFYCHSSKEKHGNSEIEGLKIIKGK